MTDTAEARIYKHTKGNTLYVSIPARMAQDSQFPFKEGDKVMLSFGNNRLVVESA